MSKEWIEQLPNGQRIKWRRVGPLLAVPTAMNIPWQHYVGDSGDEVESVEEIYPPQKIDPKDMKVKSDTEEDRERLWKSVVDYGRS